MHVKTILSFSDTRTTTVGHITDGDFSSHGTNVCVVACVRAHRCCACYVWVRLGKPLLDRKHGRRLLRGFYFKSKFQRVHKTIFQNARQRSFNREFVQRHFGSFLPYGRRVRREVDPFRWACKRVLGTSSETLKLKSRVFSSKKSQRVRCFCPSNAIGRTKPEKARLPVSAGLSRGREGGVSAYYGPRKIT